MGEEMQVAAVGRALASPARVRILRILEGGERCGCELAPLLSLDQSVVSRHLAVLSRAGLVESRREGVRILWRLSSPEILQLLRWVESLACQREAP
ncbi:MAG: ArsR/SmtB family transcription factor [Candidatus Bipolaricaulaceae bacterium]